MITGNEPAMPSYSMYDEEGELVNIYQSGVTTGRTYGLTIRQQFAMAAMQGLASTLSGQCDVKPLVAETLAKEAVLCADALIAELNKTA